MAAYRRQREYNAKQRAIGEEFERYLGAKRSMAAEDKRSHELRDYRRLKYEDLPVSDDYRPHRPPAKYIISGENVVSPSKSRIQSQLREKEVARKIMNVPTLISEEELRGKISGNKTMSDVKHLAPGRNVGIVYSGVAGEGYSRGGESLGGALGARRAPARAGGGGKIKQIVEDAKKIYVPGSGGAAWRAAVQKASVPYRSSDVVRTTTSVIITPEQRAARRNDPSYAAAGYARAAKSLHRYGLRLQKIGDARQRSAGYAGVQAANLVKQAVGVSSFSTTKRKPYKPVTAEQRLARNAAARLTRQRNKAAREGIPGLA